MSVCNICFDPYLYLEDFHLCSTHRKNLKTKDKQPAAAPSVLKMQLFLNNSRPCQSFMELNSQSAKIPRGQVVRAT